jgi:TetR/AcrR family transcriptional regulator, transcriptional repressor for nem operon
VLTGLLADMLDARSKGREKAIGLIVLMYGALLLSRAVAGTRLGDGFLRAGKNCASKR